MSLINQLPEVSTAVSGNTTTYVYYWLTGWIPCIAMNAAMATLKLRNCGGNVRILPVLQFAEVRTDKPSAVTTLAGFTALSADDEYTITATNYGIGTLAPGNTNFNMSTCENMCAAVYSD